MNILTKVTVPVLLIVGIALAVILLRSIKEEKTMAPIATKSATKTDVPPIDAAAPTDVKTATFALG